MLAIPVARLGQPEQRRHHRRNQPDTQAQRPTVVEVLAQRHGGAGRQGRAQAQGHGVHAGQGAGMLGEVALDDARQQHANHADAGPGQDAAGKQPHTAQRAAQQDAARQREQNAQHHPLAAKATRQDRCQRREQAQAQYRQRGQQAGLRSTQPQAVGHLPEQRRHARQRRAQVQCH
uniref:LigA n=1 Tax=Steinernema glaseri TaxID=37863 RepID=A0A1I8AP66_9BILA